jgi:hypothetical protein
VLPRRGTAQPDTRGKDHCDTEESKPGPGWSNLSDPRSERDVVPLQTSRAGWVDFLAPVWILGFSPCVVGRGCNE